MILSTGQVVLWRPAPGGVAQIEELRRSRVRLVYRARTGRLMRPLVQARAVTPDPAALFNNLLGRGVLLRSKEYPPPIFTAKNRVRSGHVKSDQFKRIESRQPPSGYRRLIQNLRTKRHLKLAMNRVRAGRKDGHQ